MLLNSLFQLQITAPDRNQPMWATGHNSIAHLADRDPALLAIAEMGLSLTSVCLCIK